MSTQRALFAVLILIVSCAPLSDGVLREAGFPEAIREARSLGPRAGEASFSVRAEPLRIIHRSPVTEAEGLSAILVTFNQAMVRLGPDGDASAAGVIQVTPPVAADARWVAGDTLKLALRSPLRNAQRYTVTVPTSLRALSGERLANAESWSFATPRPRLVSAEPYPEKRARHGRLLPDDQLLLTFNLAVDVDEIRRRVLLRSGKTALAVEAARDAGRDPKRVLVRPVAGFPAHAAIELELPAGLKSVEGPLGSSERSVRKLRTRAPLEVEVRCGDRPLEEERRCWPMRDGEGSLRLHLAEPVSREALIAALRVEPAADLRGRLRTSDLCGDEKRPCGREFWLARDLLPERAYRVTIAPSLTDVFGQKLGKRVEVRFTTRGFPPGLFLPAQSGVREAWQGFAFRAVNVKQVRARIRPQQGAALVRFLECHERWDESHGAERCIVGPTPPPQTVAIAAARNTVVERRLALARGLSVVTLESPEVVDSDAAPILFRRFVTQTDLGLQARITAFGVVAWVTSLKNGRPAPGARIELYDREGRRLAEAKADAAGVAEVPRSALGAVLDGKLRAPLLPSGGRYHRWWRREPAVDPPLLYVLASTGEGAARDEVHVRIGEGAERTTRALELWSRSWSAHDPEQEDDDAQREAPRPLEAVELSSFSSWEGERKQLAGYLSSERGIYRPGQTVYVQGALRAYHAWKGSPATGVRARVRLLGTENELVAERPLELSARGVFRQTLPLPANGRLGYHYLHLVVGERTVASHGFKVAEYREPPFELRVTSEPRELLRAGESLTARLQARYLFGGPVDGAAFRLSVTRSPHQVTIPGRAGYHAGGWSWTVGDDDSTWFRREGALDARGHARLAIAPPQRPYPWPCSQMIEAEVSSVDRQTVAARHYLSEQPSALYVAVADLPGEGKSARRKILVVTPAGEAVGGRRVEASVHPMEPRRYRPDWSRAIWKRSLEVPKQGSTLAVPWPDKEASSLFLLLSVRDESGRESRTASQLQRPDAWVRDEETRDEERKQREALLQLRLDRDSPGNDEPVRYLPGETALVTVIHRGPEKDGVLFVERERVFRTVPLRFDRRGEAQVRIPVEDRFARSVELRAVVARSGAALRGRLGPLLSASRTLEVSEKPYRLEVKLATDRPRYQPGDRVAVRLAVRDGLARPRQAEVVVMAVDEAVLQLTAYHLPDPLHQLLRTPPNGVIAQDVRQKLAALGIVVVHRAHGESFGVGGLGLMGSGGGGAGAGYGRAGSATSRRDSKPRRRFLTTAWHASLVTDEAGRAQASFLLPDNLTRYRLMAFAVDAARSSGTGQASFEVDLPLVTLPAFPRLLRVGDEAHAGVVVHNARLPRSTVRVRAAVEGAALRLQGTAERELVLGKDQQQEVRFGLRGVRAGEGKLRIEVELGATRDTLEHTIPVKEAILPEAASVSGETRGAVRQGLDPLESLRGDHGGLEVSLASTALTGVEDGMEQLIDYPYGCLEQKSSRLLPMLAAIALGERFSFKLPGEPRVLVRGGIDDILAMQRGDGGFGYWPGSTMSWPWATAYALIVLDRARLVAKTAALQLPEENVRRAVAYLKPYTAPFCDPSVRVDPRRRRECSPDLGLYEFSYRSFILYALALHGEEIARPALELFRRRGREPLFARAMLLAALSLRPRPEAKAAIETLARELSDSLRVDGTWAHAEENLHDGYKVMMHSSDRTTAMVLLALLQARPDHAMVPRLTRWFLLGRKQARFRNTQEAAWALLALWDYARLREREVPDFEAGVWLGGERLVTAAFRGRSVKPVLARRTMQELQRAARGAARDLIIGKRGKGTLYYVARLRFARRVLPTAARDHGFSVRKQIEVLDRAGKPLAAQRPPRLGDTVRVTLEVEANEARRYVVVEDPLPAGMEAIDVTLATGARTFGGVDAWLASSGWDHRELRDDRVLFFRDLMQPGKLTYRYLARVSFAGDFLAPPPRVEEMYTPEVFGHGASGRIRLRER
jgi:hypothetical protein